MIYIKIMKLPESLRSKPIFTSDVNMRTTLSSPNFTQCLWPLALICGAAVLLMGSAFLRLAQSSALVELYALQGQKLVGINISPMGATSSVQAASAVLVRDGVSQLFDWQIIGIARAHFLVSLNSSTSTTTETRPTHGSDLVLLDERGKTRLLARDAVLARFSPEGNNVAYISDTSTLKVVTLEGKELATLHGAVEVNWSADGKKLAITQVADEKSDERDIGILDLASKESYQLTTGEIDYAPVFDPSGNWILFLNAGRSRIGSLWAVPVAGGVPSQITNVGAVRIDENFVPIPQGRVSWSTDGTTLLYDCCRYDGRSKVWTLKFDSTGPTTSAVKLWGEGEDPRWLDASHIVISHHANLFTVLEASR